MFIAREKRKENLSEYLIYMFQIEDAIRSADADLQAIERKMIVPFMLPEATHREMVNWYANLILMMEKEKVRTKGHLQFLVNLMDDLNGFHLRLMASELDAQYEQSYKSVAGLLTEVRRRGARGNHDVETALTALYGYYILKLGKKAISHETIQAMTQISKWLGLLSELYRQFEAGEFEF
ncbi:hypothetical protein BA6E_124318 [Bacteroidales bacterium 6E]|nr:hypothetical protein BA6E_124318 [Bacteroidales bacterium 6E]